MTATVGQAFYVKRYKMELDLRDVPATPALPAGYYWMPWGSGLVEAHADVLYRSFRYEVDATVFPSFGDNFGCLCLLNEMSHKASFLPAATWLLTGPDGNLGTIQGLQERHVGAIQNVGMVPEARDRGLGTALLLQALNGFRRAGATRALLEVTAQNEAAVRLYRRLGFRCRKTLYKRVNDYSAFRR